MRVGARVVDVSWVKGQRSMLLILLLVLTSRALTLEFSAVTLAAVEVSIRSKKRGKLS